MGVRWGGDDAPSDRVITIVLLVLAVITIVTLLLTSQGDVDTPPTSPDIMEDTQP